MEGEGRDGVMRAGDGDQGVNDSQDHITLESGNGV